MPLQHGFDITFILLYIGILLFVLSIVGYIYNSKLKNENTSRLKKDQKTALKKKSKWIALIAHSSLGVAIVLMVIFLVQYTNSKYNIENLNYKADIQVTNDKDYGRGHSEAPIQYEMKIPTSGIHSPHDLRFGSYKETPPYEKLVHNLEHGDIIIYYHPNASAEVLDKINNLAHYKKAGSGVLAVPNNDVPAKDEVLVAAWMKTMELPAFDETKVGTFIYQFINTGPESIPPEVRLNGGTM
jgi:hypothetical protein